MADIAPTGRLRAAINYGNPVLAQRDVAGGEPRGVSAALARELAKRLGVELEWIQYETAGAVWAPTAVGQWDVGFLAIDPERAVRIDFTAAYVIIEGTYIVFKGSQFQQVADLDRPGVQISVGRNAAYDLYLSRTLKHAQLVRAETSSAAVELFLQQKLDAAGGVRQPLLAFAKSNDDLRVVNDSFQRIEQAMAIPKGRPTATCYVRSFVEEMKASGFISESLRISGQPDAVVAPASQQTR